MKIHSIFILVGIIILFGCKKKDVPTPNLIAYSYQKADSIKADSIRKESNYEMVDNVDHFFVEYSNDVNGYRVTTECIKNKQLTDGSWRANLFFKHRSGFQFTIIDSCYNAYALSESGVTSLSNDTTININYPASSNADTLRHDVPFFFLDVNYDGRDELIINVHGCAQRGCDMFQVFALDKSGNLLPRSKQITYQKPFVDFDDLTHFDEKKQICYNSIQWRRRRWAK